MGPTIDNSEFATTITAIDATVSLKRRVMRDPIAAAGDRFFEYPDVLNDRSNLGRASYSVQRDHTLFSPRPQWFAHHRQPLRQLRMARVSVASARRKPRIFRDRRGGTARAPRRATAVCRRSVFRGAGVWHKCCIQNGSLWSAAIYHRFEMPMGLSASPMDVEQAIVAGQERR
jgi:hypothetical protein